MPESTPPDTKQRILDAAERLFAERGFDGTSLRAITTEAGVNLAAVNYHFHSKEDLIRALFTRVVAPVNRRRMELLDDLERKAGGKPVPLPKLMDAFIGPVLRARIGGGLPVLLGRMYAEPSDLAIRMMREQMMDTAVRFVAALERTLPHLPKIELIWRIFFVVGSMSHMIVGSRLVETFLEGHCNTHSIDNLQQRLRAFAVAGLRAPSPSLEEPARRTA